MSEARPPEPSADEHDAWLHQALRHAPDAAAAPPNALREAILAEARSAVRVGRASVPRSSFIDQLAAFWSWLARPQVAAGFAGVMAATLVGMMWWDRPMDEALAPPPAPRTIAQPEAARPPAAPALADTLSSAAPAAAPTTAPGPTAPSAFAGKRTPMTTTATKAVPKAIEKDEQRKDQAATSAMPSAPAVAPFPSAGSDRSEAGARNQAVGALAKKEDAETRAIAASPPRVVAPEPTPAAAPAEAARSADAAVADAKSLGASGEPAKAAPAQRERGAATTRDAADALVARSAPPRGAAPAPQAFAAAQAPAREGSIASERRDAIDAAARPMVALLDSLSNNPERWTRPVASGAPVSAATQAWLASVDAATAGRWQARAERSSRLRSADGASTLPLSRDGRVAAVVRIEEGGVFFEMQPGPAWFAPLPADVLARLRASLPPIAR